MAAAEVPTALAWSQDSDDVTDVAQPAALEFSRPHVEYGERDWDDIPPRRRGPLIAFGVSAAAAVAALAVFGMTQFDDETAPANSASSIAVSTAPATSTQPVVSPVAETAATIVVTPAPRLVPVAEPSPHQPAPQTTTVTTTATPTTTTTTPTTTPTTTTPTTTLTSTSPTSTPTSTSTPEMTIPIDPGPGNGH
ncbi:MAG: hypothetical protein QOF25_4379 [Mycobacterium sp.]|nr:hypothetical protein [Mycobacterium sp.]